MADTPLAVVVGLDCVTGLQTARLLASRGVPVLGIAADPRHFGARTGVCQQVLVADTAKDDFVDLLERLGPSLPHKAVLYPCTDLSVMSISRERERLSPWYEVLLPKHDVVQTLLDKGRFTEYALEHGLPIPPSVVVRTPEDIDRACRLRFPCVVKPAVKTAFWQQHTKAKAFRAADPAGLRMLCEQVGAWSDTLVVQEWVPGGEGSQTTCNAYFDSDSRPLVTFVSLKLRQWPIGTGTGCLGQEHRDDVVLHETVRLFSDIGFHGLAYLEMKQHADTGERFIIEPNVGRPTGRSPLAEGCGVELVMTAYCDAVGLPLPADRTQVYGTTKWVDDRRDLMSAVTHWSRRELTAADWWRSVRGPKVHAVWSPRDPLPFMVDVAATGRKAVRAIGLRAGLLGKR
jgi:predicted ATP-grasp superfamily ATP-dependent carboligase